MRFARVLWPPRHCLGVLLGFSSCFCVFLLCRRLGFEVSPQNARFQHSILEAQSPNIEAQPLSLEAQTQNLEAEAPNLEAQRQSSKPRPQTSKTRPQTSKPRPRTSRPRPQTSKPSPQASKTRRNLTAFQDDLENWHRFGRLGGLGPETEFPRVFE